MARRTSEDRIVVVLAGAIDRAATDVLLDELRHVGDGARRPVVLDLSSVTYLDSAGLRTLLVAQRETAAAGGSLTIHDASPTVRRLLDLTGTGSVFERAP